MGGMMRVRIQVLLLSVMIMVPLSFGFTVQLPRPPHTSLFIAHNNMRSLSSHFPFSLFAQGDDDFDSVKVPRRRQQGRRFEDEEDEEFYDIEDEYDDEDEEWDEDDDEDDDEDEEYGFFSNVLIDNPILDSIDPDGAAERFPELASDPRFWVDIALFLLFLELLSFVGPRNPDYNAMMMWNP
jgi:hypothetical protein